MSSLAMIDTQRAAKHSGKVDDTLELLKQMARSFLVEVGTLNMFESQDFKHLNFYDEVRRFEISLIERALVQTAGHQRRAARLLGLGATTLNAKIKHYDIKYKADDDLEKSSREADLFLRQKQE